jgi:hypothetical protein
VRTRTRPRSPRPAATWTPLLGIFTLLPLVAWVTFAGETLGAENRAPAAVSVAITPRGVLFDDELVASLREGRATPAEYEARRLATLVDVLEVEYEKRYGDRAGHAEDDEPTVIVEADRSTDYKTLYLVLRSAAEAGFFRYRLTVIGARG